METRTLTEDDAEAYRQLRVRGLGEEPRAFARTPEEADSVDEMRRRLRTTEDGTDGFILGAFENGRLVGLVGCRRPEPGAKRRHIAMIWGMYVVPEVRGRGVGRRLLQEAVERARQWRDLDHVWLSVVTTQTAARALYASCGFEVFGRHPRALKVGDRFYDEELMVLELR